MGLEKVLQSGIILGSLFLTSCNTTQTYAQEPPKQEVKTEQESKKKAPDEELTKIIDNLQQEVCDKLYNEDKAYKKVIELLNVPLYNAKQYDLGQLTEERKKKLAEAFHTLGASFYSLAIFDNDTKLKRERYDKSIEFKIEPVRLYPESSLYIQSLALSYKERGKNVNIKSDLLESIRYYEKVIELEKKKSDEYGKSKYYKDAVISINAIKNKYLPQINEQ